MYNSRKIHIKKKDEIKSFLKNNLSIYSLAFLIKLTNLILLK